MSVSSALDQIIYSNLFPNILVNNDGGMVGGWEHKQVPMQVERESLIAVFIGVFKNVQWFDAFKN